MLSAQTHQLKSMRYIIELNAFTELGVIRTNCATESVDVLGGPWEVPTIASKKKIARAHTHTYREVRSGRGAW